MNCKKCGTEITLETAAFCPMCGTRIGHPPPHKQGKKHRGNGQGTVIRRNKTYTAIITVGSYYDEKNDKVVRKRVSKGGFTTKKEAYNYIPTLRDQVYGAPPPKDISFFELYQKWLPEHSGKVTPSTMNCYKSAWKYYEAIYAHKLSTIRTSLLQECINQCPRGKRSKENMRALATLLYKYALANDLVKKNCAEYLTIDSDEKSAPREAFTSDELKAMWKAADKDPGDDIGLALILCYTGMRLGELLSLRGTNYHEENGVHYFIGGSKTQAGRNRTIPIPPRILPILQHWGAGTKTDEVLISVNGRQMRQKDFREKHYYPALKRLGLKRLVPHCCRHTYATLLKKVDVSDADKMKAIGHSEQSMLLHYTHSDLEGVKKIANQIDV